MRELSLREAVPDDAQAIARVHVRGWQIGYRGIVPDAVLDGLSVAQREHDWLTRLSERRSDAAKSSTFVADSEGELVGFATVLAPGRGEDLGPRTCELAALYVEPRRWRQGIGRALLRESMDVVRADGWAELAAWVLAENAPARAFYERHGFAADGARQEHERSGETVVTLRAPLGG